MYCCNSKSLVSAFVVLTLFLQFFCAANKTIIESVIPLTAQNKKVPVYLIGAIITSIYISGLLTNLVFLKFSAKINVEKSFIVAAPLTSIMMVALGFCYYIENSIAFEIFCITDRLICGITNAIEYCCMVPMVTSIVPKQSALFITVLQIFDGAGSLSGPVIGSLFTQVFSIPTMSFTILGIAQFLISLLILLLLNFIKNNRSNTHESKIKYENSMSSLLQNTRILPFSIFSLYVLFCMVMTGFFETSITIVYKEELDIGYDFNWIFFAFRDISYILSSFLISLLIQKKINNFIFASSLIFFTISNGIYVAINIFEWQTTSAYVLTNIIQAMGYAAQSATGLFILEQCVNLDSLHPTFVRFVIFTWLMMIRQGGRLFGTQVVGGFLFTYFSFYQLMLGITLTVNLPLIIVNMLTLGFGHFCVKYDNLKYQDVDNDESLVPKENIESMQDSIK